MSDTAVLLSEDAQTWNKGRWKVRQPANAGLQGTLPLMMCDIGARLARNVIVCVQIKLMLIFKFLVACSVQYS